MREQLGLDRYHTVVDVIRTTPLGLENPLSAGCEYVNGEITCLEMASSISPSASMSISKPARALSSSTMRSTAPMKGITGPCSSMSLRQAPSGQARASCEEAQHGTTGLPLPRALSPRRRPRAPHLEVAFKAQGLFRCPAPRQGAGA